MFKIKYLLIVLSLLILSCSKDDPNEEEEIVEETQVCEIEGPDLGCAEVYLQGNRKGWLPVLKVDKDADPLFLYPVGEKDDAYGIVTISLENGFPVIKMNDVILDDYIIRISKNSTGENSFCRAEENITYTSPEGGPDVSLKLNQKVELPFYIQIQANVCF